MIPTTAGAQIPHPSTECGDGLKAAGIKGAATQRDRDRVGAAAAPDLPSVPARLSPTG